MRRKISHVLVVLDVSRPAVLRAARIGADVIVSHHPIWWDPPRTLVAHEPGGVGAILASERKIAVIAAHTNADFAPNGLCDELARMLGLSHIEPLRMEGSIPVGRIGNADRLRPVFTKGRVAGIKPKKIRRIAVCSGSGSDLLSDAAAAGADIFVTGDVKYHAARDAETLGICLIDAGHFETERVFVSMTAKRLAKLLPEVTISSFLEPPPFRGLPSL